LEDVLSELEQLYGVDFAYEGVVIADKYIRNDEYERIKNAKEFDKALQQLLKPLTLTYKKFDKYYVIQKEEESVKPVQKIKTAFQSAGEAQGGSQFLRIQSRRPNLILEMVEKSISGKITDENSEPLPGVNI